MLSPPAARRSRRRGLRRALISLAAAAATVFATLPAQASAQREPTVRPAAVRLAAVERPGNPVQRPQPGPAHAGCHTQNRPGQTLASVKPGVVVLPCFWVIEGSWPSLLFCDDEGQFYLNNVPIVRDYTCTKLSNGSWLLTLLLCFNVNGVNYGQPWVDYKSGLYLDVGADGESVIQNYWTGADSQWWLLFPDPWGYDQLINGTGKCLGVNGGSLTEGVQAVVWSCNDHYDQEWSFESLGQSVNGNPVYKVVDRNSGMVLAINGGSLSAGADAIQWPWNGHTDQQWFPACASGSC